MSEDGKPFAEKPPAGEPSAEKPFTEFATKGGRGADTARRGWIAAGVMTVLLIAALLLWASALGRLGGMAALQSRLDQAKSSLAGVQAENEKDKGQIAALQLQVADLEKEKEMVGQRAKVSKMKCAPTWSPGMSPSPTSRAGLPSTSSTG
jgi:cell division protein FtsB